MHLVLFGMQNRTFCPYLMGFSFQNRSPFGVSLTRENMSIVAGAQSRNRKFLNRRSAQRGAKGDKEVDRRFD
jgi:hypothetical protein